MEIFVSTISMVFWKQHLILILIDILMQEELSGQIKKILIISLTEAIIYSGQNRGFEIGYFNPIGSHLEIELNNRLTTLNSK